jgi:pyruvate/2-oxoglutarate dehydrogenase complex dihydrolipoamide dehydrogenase (E3) component
VIPWCTYTSPEVAHVGLTAKEAAERRDVETITIPMHDVDRARLDGEEEGFLRVHLAAGSDRILGATLVAGHAGDLISQLTQAMTAGIGLGKVGETIFPYPTQAEVIRKAADAWRRTKLTPRAKAAFRLFFRALR